MEAVGVDGCPGGWIAYWMEGSAINGSFYPSASELVRTHRRAKVIAVDIPIGLAESGARRPDELARKALGVRSCCVFNAPLRALFAATSQRHASELRRSIDGKGFGAQAFSLMPKIREWDELLLIDVEARAIVHEVHPEVSFAVMQSGQPVRDSKKSVAGQKTRYDLLALHFGRAPVKQAFALPNRGAAKLDDSADALVALWTAERIARGSAHSLPHPPATDRYGIPMAIWS